MWKLQSVLGLVLAGGAIFALSAAGPADALDDDHGFVTVKKETLAWQPAAEFPGIDFALLEGNPTGEGIYVLRARFAPGVMSRPHFHSTDRLVTVISGVWYAGTDASFDPAKTTPLYPGDFMKHPAGGVHFDGAKDIEVVVEITGMGPVTTTSVPTTPQK